MFALLKYSGFLCEARLLIGIFYEMHSSWLVYAFF